MAGRRMFTFFTQEKSWSPNASGGSGDGEPKTENRRRLSISRSGRFKEQNRKRTVLSDSVYVPPTEDEKNKAAPEFTKEEMESIMAIEKVLPPDIVDDWKTSTAVEDLERREATLRKIRTHIRERMETAM